MQKSKERKGKEMNQTFKSFIVSLLVSASVCGISAGIYAGVENSGRPDTEFTQKKYYLSSTSDERETCFEEFYCELDEDGTYTDRYLLRKDKQSNTWHSNSLTWEYEHNGEAVDYELCLVNHIGNEVTALLSKIDGRDQYFLLYYEFPDGSFVSNTGKFSYEIGYTLSRYSL
jgi:hypothetical protein